MEGLDASVLSVKNVISDSTSTRIDSGYFSKSALAAERTIARLPHCSLDEVTSVFRKGIFDIRADTYVGIDKGVPFVRIGDLDAGLIRKESTVWISENAHNQEAKTALGFGDLVLSKTAYPAASMVTLKECNVSQDIIAARLNAFGRAHFRSGFVAAFLNSNRGLELMTRRFQGNVQQHLSLEDGKTIKIPRFELALQRRVHQVIQDADANYDESTAKQAYAETTLLEDLGLADWTPPVPLSYAARASDVVAAGRMDASFHAPRMRALLDIINRDGRTIADVAMPRRQKFQPAAHEQFHYIEIGSVDRSGAAKSVEVASADAPARATWYVRPHDIITSTVRPLRRLSAKIAPEQDGHVCSSGFVVMTPEGIAPDLLLTYLRLPVICELLDLHASASMYPAVGDAHVFGLPVPMIAETTERRVVSSLHSARKARSCAVRLLGAASRAVDIAIEDGEPAAMTFLNEAGGAS